MRGRERVLERLYRYKKVIGNHLNFLLCNRICEFFDDDKQYLRWKGYSIEKILVK